ncbi:MAG: carboxymuconolactone decarboxylase family protein [Candidatus Binatia bacterium]
MIMESRLSQKDRELVMLSASVAAGCIPCTQYHMKAVQAAGADTEEITEVVNTARNVKAGANRMMVRVASEALGLPGETEPSCFEEPTDRMTALAAIAAAVAANCPPLFHQQVQGGRAVGVGDDEIRLVVRIGQMIRGKATEKMDEAAEGTSAAASVPADGQCGCCS